MGQAHDVGFHADPGRRGRGAELRPGRGRGDPQRYRERRDVLVEGFARRLAGALARRPRCSSGRRCPSRIASVGSLAFSKLLLEEAKVAVSPGIGFGEYGEGHVRLALVENRQRIRQAARNVKTFLARQRRRGRRAAARRGRWPEAMPAAASASPGSARSAAAC